MVAIFGPAITGEADMRCEEEGIAAEQALSGAIHSAISAILMREFPEATEKRGLDEAVADFEGGYGMRYGYPSRYDYENKDDAVTRGRADHLAEMRRSSYTVTLGQAARALLPYMEAFDNVSTEIFDKKFPHFLSRAFQGVWHELLEQDMPWERFSDAMTWQYLGLNKPYAELPEPDKGLRRDLLNQRFVMTEADVRRIYSGPIAKAFQENIGGHGELKPEVAN